MALLQAFCISLFFVWTPGVHSDVFPREELVHDIMVSLCGRGVAYRECPETVLYILVLPASYYIASPPKTNLVHCFNVTIGSYKQPFT